MKFDYQWLTRGLNRFFFLIIRVRNDVSETIYTKLLLPEQEDCMRESLQSSWVQTERSGLYTNETKIEPDRRLLWLILTSWLILLSKGDELNLIICQRLLALALWALTLIFLDENCQYSCILVCNFVTAKCYWSRWENKKLISWIQ